MSQHKPYRIEFDPASRQYLEDVKEKIGASSIDEVVARGIDVLRWIIQEGEAGATFQLKKAGEDAPKTLQFKFLENVAAERSETATPQSTVANK